MDWENEHFIKVYTRETDDDLALSWEARAVWDAAMKRFDRSGVITTKRGPRGLAAILRIPATVVERVIEELLSDGRLIATDVGYVAPNYVAAQTARMSDALRQKEARERRRADSLSTVPAQLRLDKCLPPHVSVTFRDGNVTPSHTASHGVTPSHTASRLEETRLEETRDQNADLSEVGPRTSRDGQPGTPGTDVQRPTRPTVPERALGAADALRGMILREDPKAAVGRKPWEGVEGMRGKWGRAIKLLVERDGRTYEEIWDVMCWLRDQPPGPRFVVQSPDALRAKWDRIAAKRRNDELRNAAAGSDGNARTRGSPISVFQAADEAGEVLEREMAKRSEPPVDRSAEEGEKHAAT